MDSDRIHVASGVRASISHDGLVLLDVHGGLVFASNSVGARIWQLIEARRPRTEIARQLADDYNIGFDRAQTDVIAFVDTLAARGLVAVSEDKAEDEAPRC
jgi:hypothetical protein